VQSSPLIRLTNRVIAAGRAAVELLKDGVALEKLHLSRKEQEWLTRIDDALGAFQRTKKALDDRAGIAIW